MKYFLLTMLIILPNFVWANNECSVEVVADKFVIYAGDYSRGTLSLHSEMLPRPSALSCFERAIEKCSEFSTFAVQDLKQLASSTFFNSTVKAQVYCNWEFNDGYINDSNGSVTKFTDPQHFELGNARTNAPEDAK